MIKASFNTHSSLEDQWKYQYSFDDGRKKILPLYPADAVERYLYPVYAKRVDLALQLLKEKKDFEFKYPKKLCVVK